MSVHFSSKSNEWTTPPIFFEKLNAEFHFSLDVAATRENAKCELFFSAETHYHNGLLMDWAEYCRQWCKPEVAFMNPPYGREVGIWMKKAFEESKKGCTVVCLVPSRTDTAWWHDYAMKGEIRHIRGRLYFGANGDHSGRAPFPSAIVIFK